MCFAWRTCFFIGVRFGLRTWGFVKRTSYIGWRTWFLFGALGTLVGVHGVFVIGILFDLLYLDVSWCT